MSARGRSAPAPFLHDPQLQWFRRLNPNGIPSQSPGLRGTSYPGSRPTNISNRNAVAAHPFPPVRLVSVSQFGIAARPGNVLLAFGVE